MNSISMIPIIIGILLALFLPGYLIARIFFRELSELEKVAFGFVLSIVMDVILGLFLGYNQKMKDMTGGITAQNIWIYLGAITAILIVTWSIKNKDEFNHVFRRSTAAGSNYPESEGKYDKSKKKAI